MQKHLNLVDLVKNFPMSPFVSSNEYLLAKIGVDTTANEPLKVYGEFGNLEGRKSRSNSKYLEFEIRAEIRFDQRGERVLVTSSPEIGAAREFLTVQQAVRPDCDERTSANLVAPSPFVIC